MDVLPTLVPFALIASFTPGPNNILVMAEGVNRGLRATLAYQAGAGVACFLIIYGCMLAGARLETLIPPVIAAMRYAGCAYMLWLAWMVVTARPVAVSGRAARATLLTGFVMQFVNPKYYLYVLTLTAVLVPAAHSPLRTLLYAVFFAALAVAGMFAWAVSGSLLQRFLLTWRRPVNAVMGAALVWCAWSLL